MAINYVLIASVTVQQTDQFFNPNGQAVTLTGTLPLPATDSGTINAVLSAAEPMQAARIVAAIASMSTPNPGD